MIDVLAAKVIFYFKKSEFVFPPFSSKNATYVLVFFFYFGFSAIFDFNKSLTHETP